MKIKLAYVTSIRSEFGLSRQFLESIKQSDSFELFLYVSGTHLLPSFGNTIEEIRSSGLSIRREVPVFREGESDKGQEFSSVFNVFYQLLKSENLDGLFVVGDRPEAYAVALASHFLNIPIFHCGGGALTRGAIDDIYRYNITNLATLHFATSNKCYERLLALPTINREQVFLSGILAIDAIRKFIDSPLPIYDFVPGLVPKEYCLMTFHPATNSGENIPELMSFIIDEVIKRGHKILVTYPNNDTGFEEIIDVIHRYKGNLSVKAIKSLGAPGYYAALNDCSFVIGNSSSGIVEAPYFGRKVINVGLRQDGRDFDVSVSSFLAQDKLDITSAIAIGIKERFETIENNMLYGKGGAVKLVLEQILGFYKGSTDRLLVAQ